MIKDLKIKGLSIILIIFLNPITLIAQQSKIPKHWTQKRKIGLLLTQNTFIDWVAGGDNSIAGIVSFLWNYDYLKEHLFWNNRIEGRYGMNKKEEMDPQKTEDVFRLESSYGYQRNKKSNWYYSAKFSLITQFAEGYKYPNTQTSISDFFAPAYVFLGLGTQFTSTSKKTKIYLSPLTKKTTFVLNQRLADNGAYGVKKAVKDEKGNIISSGENIKTEFGTQLSAEMVHQIMKNIQLWNKAMLYSDYLDNYGTIDIDWQCRLKFIVNTNVEASLSVHIIYDEDSKDKKDGIAKVQLKQILGIGFSYSF